MLIAPHLLDQIIEHARRDAPNECCGVVIARDGVAEEVRELENVMASPRSFKIDDKTLLDVYNDVEDREGTFAIYHSHTRSEPRPSQTDINFGVNWPGVEWIIVGLAGPEPDVRSWLIAPDGSVVEATLAAP